MKLTARLTLTLVLYAAGLLASVAVLAYATGREALRTATISELLSTAIEKQGALTAWVEGKQQDIAIVAADPAVLSAVNVLRRAPSASSEARAARAQWLMEVQPRVGPGGFTGLMVIEPVTGQVLVATDPAEEGKLKEDQPFFLNGGIGPYVQDLYYSVALQAPAMTAAAPLHAPDGALIGVLAGQMDLAEMNAIINRRTGVHRTDDAFLVNRSHLFVTQPRFISDLAVLRRVVYTEAVNRCLTEHSGVIDQRDYRGVPVIASYQWLLERELCLIVKLDQAEAYAPVLALGKSLAAISALGLAAAAALAVILARGLVRPILAVHVGAARFGRGDLNIRLRETSKDELGALARAFNAMAEALTEKDDRLRARAAELEASNRELEAFSYSVSHDLRAPLRAIDGFSRILSEEHATSLDERGLHHLERVRASTQYMGRLIDDLLALSRLSRMELSRRVIQPADVARQAVELLRDEEDSHPVEIEIDDVTEASADPALLRQVYVNLVSNALKFTRGRTPARIHVGGRRQDGETVYFVRDNGVGFDMAHADRLFGVFQRLHHPDEYDGTGVGLAIVQRIVQRHGGRVWAESAPDRGATFFFSLPHRSQS